MSNIAGRVLICAENKPSNQLGLSLVELLISMVIAAFIFSGVLTVMLSSRNSHVSEQETGMLQENQRFATALLTRDIRLAGSFGCGATERASVVNSVDPLVVADGGLLDGGALMGYEGTSDTSSFPSGFQANAAAGSDAIILRYADPDTSVSIKSHSPNSAVMHLHQDHRFNEDDILMVVDSTCRHVGVFQLTAGNSNKINHNAGSNRGDAGNCTKVLFAPSSIDCTSASCGPVSCGGYSAAAYGDGSEVMQFVANAYYIGPSTVLPGVTALKRQVLSEMSTRAEEIAQGVESMELLYGVDTDTPKDGDIDRFVSADNVVDWTAVLAVRFNLIFRSQIELFDADQTVTINGVSYTDRYLRKLSSSTVQVRNRGL